jgi:hypothetical protein
MFGAQTDLSGPHQINVRRCKNNTYYRYGTDVAHVGYTFAGFVEDEMIFKMMYGVEDGEQTQSAQSCMLHTTSCPCDMATCNLKVTTAQIWTLTCAA